MSRNLAEVSVLPLYGQVVIQDVDATDLPDWVTGDEAAVASDHAVFVATRGDCEGPVTVVVMDGEPDEPAGDTVFEGELTLTTSLVEVGSTIAGMTIQTSVGRPGRWRIRVRATPPLKASRIDVAFVAWVGE